MSREIKARLFGFAAFVVAAVGFVGIAWQTSSATTPGQVGNAPRCDAQVSGDRSKAFTVNEAGTRARVEFTVSGPKNCKVQLRVNSFYAPAIDGMPYDKQVLFDHNSRVFTPGTYTMSVDVPTKSTEAKGCFYQLDLTYGNSEINVRPVIAYAHGKVAQCGEKPKPPVTTCDSLTAVKVNPTTYRFTAAATAAGGATLSNYHFAFGDETAKKVTNDTVQHTYQKPGTYTARVTALFKVDGKVVEKTSSNCTTTVSVEKEPVAEEPRISIVKKVDGVEHKTVGVDQVFTYTVVVGNTGTVALTNVKVTDTPPAGVALISASAANQTVGTIANNTWSYTMPSLPVNTELTFSITAKVPKYLAGTLTNTACVQNDKVDEVCDDASVDVTKPVQGAVAVCKPGEDGKVGTIITVPVNEKDRYKPVDDPACQPKPEMIEVCVLEDMVVRSIPAADYDDSLHSKTLSDCDEKEVVETKETVPATIASTGPEMVASGLFGSGAIGYGAYSFASSRRNLMQKLLSRR